MEMHTYILYKAEEAEKGFIFRSSCKAQNDECINWTPISDDNLHWSEFFYAFLSLEYHKLQ